MEFAAPGISSATPSRVDSPAVRLYLRLLQRCLVRDLFPDQRYQGCDLSHVLGYSQEMRENGLDWPTEALTMVGMKRLNSLQECCLSVLQDDIPGDFVETGSWRGGCGILMRAILEACGDSERKVWLFDSFEGLPKPNTAAFPADSGDQYWTFNSYLGVTLEQVKANFQQYDLLDDRVRFVKGWFSDTIPTSHTGPISVLRLDGDMYESTWIVLAHLYSRVSPGGFVVIDDYGAVPGCKQAVDDFRREHSIQSPMSAIDWTGAFWRKSDSAERQESGDSCDRLQLEQKLHALEVQYGAATAELRSALAARDELSSALKERNERQSSALKERNELQSEVEQLTRDIAAANARLEAERAVRENIEHSKSWRITAPLRRLMAAFRAS